MDETRDRVLETLRDHAPGWVSGNAIGCPLGISRAAVHKHVRTLQGMGFRVESLARRGYRLRIEPDDLDAPNFLPLLRTQHLARTGYRFVPVLESTNDAIRLEAQQDAPHGTVLVADGQTRGRGRMGRTWISPPTTGLYVSLLLRPSMDLAQLPRIVLLGAVAAAQAVRNVTGAPAAIKWPNDIFLHQRKIAGILTETSAEPDAIEYVIVGLGLNVNTARNDLPPDCRFPASSLRIETGKPWPRGVLLAAWLEQIETLWPLLVTRDPRPLQSRWNELSATRGHIVRIDTPTGMIEGQDLGIAPEGALRIRDPQNPEHRVLCGDLIRIGSNLSSHNSHALK